MICNGTKPQLLCTSSFLQYLYKKEVIHETNLQTASYTTRFVAHKKHGILSKVKSRVYFGLERKLGRVALIHIDLFKHGDGAFIVFLELDCGAVVDLPTIAGVASNVVPET